MNRYETLIGRLRRGERIVIDGATGTEADRRGAPQLDNAWNGGATLSHPRIVRDIHEDYIARGAEIVISNTFATHRHALRDAGVADRFEDYNRRGVELAREARERAGRPDVLVAGGMSCWTWTGRRPTLEELSSDAGEQAAVMADAGADLLMLEMMVDIDRMLALLEAGQAAGLPVWVGFSCRPDEAGTVRLYNGEALADALAALEGRGAPLVNIMHTEVGHVDACLDVLDAHWPGLVGVYAHTGRDEDDRWIFDDAISPEDYAAAARRWFDRGVAAVGGCCGIRVEHIAAVKAVA